MKFGFLEMDELDRADLRLPPDGEGNAATLARPTGAAAPAKAFIGLAEYRVREWNNLLYPAGTKEADMLRRYSEQYNCMEMNGTHYRIYEPERIGQWTEKVARPDFLFLPKFPQLITHEVTSYEQLQITTAAFLESIEAFRPYLGPLFMQMSERFSPDNRKGLFRYLASLPEGYTFFLELRHRGWFADAGARAELFSALRDLGIGAVITDTPGHREVCHMELTIPKTMIRFVGRHRHPSTAPRISAWMQRIKSWLDGGLEELYFFVHTGLSAPRTSVQVVQEFNAVCGFDLTVPKLWEQAELF